MVRLLYLYILLLFTQNLFGQKTTIITSTDTLSRTVIAGKEYAAGKWKRFQWGNDYRNEWTVPVKVPVLNLDSAFGGLTPVELGGGRQTKSLHLKDPTGRRYVLRTVNKTYTGALPEIARGTFVEKIANDQVATNHPYAALSVPMMASAAGIFHTNPMLVFVTPSERLGEYNKLFANTLCLLEERPDKTQTGQESFGHPVDIESSEKMVKEVTEDNDRLVDQNFYLKTRLFDIFLGDWGRHIDNWRWAEFDSGNKTFYKPVPKDRDQAYAKFEGFLLNTIKMATGLKQLQSFSDHIKNIAWYNYPAMEIDRRFTNGLERKAWIDSARAIQRYLADEVIVAAVHQMPAPVVALSGQEIISNLKKRRDDLVKYAEQYYSFLSRKVDIPGSSKNEAFIIKRLNNDSTIIAVYKVNKKGQKDSSPIYQRTFLNKETSEIRLYGINGNDSYNLTGQVEKGITIRLIGGPGKDTIVDHSRVNGSSHKTRYYDNKLNKLTASFETKVRINDTTYVYPFDEDYQYDSRGYSVFPGLSPYYRFYIGVGFKEVVHGWREKPFKKRLRYGINYSISENSWSPYINWTFPHLFSTWNLNINGGYDGTRRSNFYGVGNETQKQSLDEKYHILRTENFYGNISLDKYFGTYHNFKMLLGYDGIRVIPQPQKFLDKQNSMVDNTVFSFKHFGSVALSYSYSRLNNKVLPTKGSVIVTSVELSQNLQEKGNHFTRYTGSGNFYIKFGNAFSVAINPGFATMNGTSEFYQLNTIGGNLTVRGYRRNRFYGKTVVYDQNELRWIPNVKSYLFNGKAGLAAVYDIGKVWQPLQKSDKWHHGYGAGIIISPFNKITASLYYTISPEDKMLNVRIGKFF